MQQYNLEMMPVESVLPVQSPVRSFRRYRISSKAVNMVDQIHMLSDVRKSDVVDDAILVLATLIKCGKMHGFRLEDAEQITEVLERYSREKVG